MTSIVLTEEERAALTRAAEMMRNAATLQLEIYWGDIYEHRAKTLEQLLARSSEQDKCEHGAGVTDYCQPCGRTSNA